MRIFHNWWVVLLFMLQTANGDSQFNVSNVTFDDSGEYANMSFDMPLDVIVFGTVLYVIIFLIGVLGNIMVIVVLFKNKELRNSTNYFLANLSIADLMILLVCVPSALHDLYAKDRWYLGLIVCKLIAFIENCAGIASIFTILIISCERFFAICQPFKVQNIITKSRTLKLIVVVWLTAITLNSPFIYLTHYELDHLFTDGTTGARCVTVIESNLSQAFFIISTFVIYLAMGIILMIIYWNICKSLAKSTMLFNRSDKKNVGKGVSKFELNRMNNRLNSIEPDADDYNSLNEIKFTKNLNELGSPVSTSGTVRLKSNNLLNVNNTMNYLKPRRQLILMLICVIAVFYICIFPSKISFLFFKELSLKLSLRSFYYVNIIIRSLFYLNSSVNPILYNWLSTKFRRCFMRALSCQNDNAINRMYMSTYSSRNVTHDTATLMTTNGSIYKSSKKIMVNFDDENSNINIF